MVHTKTDKESISSKGADLSNLRNKRDYVIHVKIPKDRIAVLIGTKGKTKLNISEETGCKIYIDSDTGIVEIKSNDALKVYQAKDIITAIARGFSPEKALLLLRTDYTLDVINLKELVRSRNQIKRVKGRVIGEKGKSRAFIEDVTDTYISVYGKTVSIIGMYDKMGIVRRGLMMLINGSPHSRVQIWLEKKMKEFKTASLMLKGSDEAEVNKESHIESHVDEEKKNKKKKVSKDNNDSKKSQSNKKLKEIKKPMRNKSKDKQTSTDKI